MHLKKCYLVTTTSVDFLPLTHDIAAAVKEADVSDGVVHVVVPKGGAGLLIFKDTPELRDELAPKLHPALLPRSLALPLADGELPLSPYEEVILVDCEPRVQRREVVITVSPESEKGTTV